MAYRTYSTAQKVEAIALCEVVGPTIAAERLSEQWGANIKAATLRSWLEAAGKSRQDLDLPQDALDDAYQLALAKVTAEIASGKLKGVPLAVVTGILADKRRNEARDRERKAVPAESWGDRLDRELDALYGTRLGAIAGLAVTVLFRDEVRRQMAEPGYVPAGDFSDEPKADPEAEDRLIAWCLEYVAGLGDLDAWQAAWDERHQQELTASRAKWEDADRAVVDDLIARAETELLEVSDVPVP